MLATQAGQQPISIVPATPERWPDIEAFFAGIACWCQYWRVSAQAYGRVTSAELRAGLLDQRREALRQQLEDVPAPGMLAYSDGIMVGWCGFGPRQQLERLRRSRTIPTLDERPVWAIVCFIVRPGYRRRGIARALLQGTIAYARAGGAPALEAYPIDPGARRVDGAAAYVGTLPMFEQAGFQRIVLSAARSAGLPRWVMRLELADAAGSRPPPDQHGTAGDQ